ncbi:MAG: DUF1573 domain-containing protein [Bacteroidota bacterium]
MNPQLKTVLLTVLTLSVFVIALVELSGVSSTALVNKFKSNGTPESGPAVVNSKTGTAFVDARDQQVTGMPKTTIQFEETKFDFGTIKEGDVVKHAFRFRNTGSNPLMISRTDVSCGCTTPSFPKEPIQPGGEGEIMVQFNSANKKGHQEKNVLVHSNAQQEAMSIGFVAEVKEK